MNLECSKNKERNPFTKKCVMKCRKGTRRIRNGKKKKFVCFKPCKKGTSRSKASNRCKTRSLKNKSASALLYYTAQNSPSLKYYHNNASPEYSGHNEMRGSLNFTPSSHSMTFHTPLTSEKPGSPSLAYYHSNASPEYSGHNEMRGSLSEPRHSISSQSLEYIYDKSPDFANENEMRGLSGNSLSSQSLEYLYNKSPDFANLNEMRKRSKSKSKSRSRSKSK
jgi:hypothetical protein